MRIDEITTAKLKLPKRPKPIKPRSTIKPNKKTLPTIKPQTANQAMIAAKKRQVEVAKDALKAEKAYQKRRKQLEKQRKALTKR